MARSAQNLTFVTVRACLTFISFMYEVRLFSVRCFDGIFHVNTKSCAQRVEFQHHIFHENYKLSSAEKSTGSVHDSATLHAMTFGREEVQV